MGASLDARRAARDRTTMDPCIRSTPFFKKSKKKLWTLLAKEAIGILPERSIENMSQEPTLQDRVLMNHKRIVMLEEAFDRLIAVLEKITSTQGEIVDKVTESQDDDIDDGMTDVEADSDALRCAGWGTDEDYGGTDERL